MSIEGKGYRLLLLAAISLLTLVSCGRRVSAPPPTPAPMQEGLASWYGKGDGFHGKIAANGKRFDRSKLTAAHFDLPFESIVQVTNLKNGKRVQVRITDRFPMRTLKKGRIIDLSFKAAQTLGMVRDGVVPVRLEVLRWGS